MVVVALDPAEVQVTRRNTAIELVRQVVFPVDKHRKRELLTHLIKSGRIDRALVFVRTKHGAQRLSDQLERDGISAAAIHGDRTQGQRIRALDDFKDGKVAFLVATEVAARGLDIDGLPHVVNFELPTVTEDYIHRIGRTGRAGMEGDAISLVCLEELDQLNDIEALLRKQIRDEVVPGFELDRNARPSYDDEYRPARGRSSSNRHRESRGGGDRGRGGARSGGSRTGAAPAGRSHAGPLHGGGSRSHGSRPMAPRSDAPRPARTGGHGGGSMVAMPGERFARDGAAG